MLNLFQHPTRYVYERWVARYAATNVYFKMNFINY